MPKKLLVIESDRGNPANQRALDHVGRVEPPAEPHLHDARIRRLPREGEDRRRGRDLEESRVDACSRSDHLLEQVGERLVLDQRACDPDALVEAHQVRAGERVHAVPSSFESGAQERAGRALPVRAGDVEHMRQAVLRPSEPLQQARDPIEPEPVPMGGDGAEAVELRLDGRMVRPREIRHQAARFSGAR